MIRVIETPSEFDAIKPIWEKLEVASEARIFQTYLWCRLAWKIFSGSTLGGSLWILMWESNSDLEDVILPTYIDDKGALRYIFDNSSDTCDAVCIANVNHNLAFSEFAKKIKAERRIKCVRLQKMSSESVALNYFGVLLKGAIVGKDNAYSWLDIEPCDDFIAAQHHMKSKDRSDLKCLKRKCDVYSLQVLSYANKDDFPASEFENLRDDMRATGRRSNGYFNDQSIEFVHHLYMSGRCDVAMLSRDGHVIAMNVILRTKKRLLSWVFLYSDPRASTALYLKLFCEYNFHLPFVFDFGVGVYSYKIGTFRPFTTVTFSLRYGKGILRQIIEGVGMVLRFTKDYIKVIRC